MYNPMREVERQREKEIKRETERDTEREREKERERERKSEREGYPLRVGVFADRQYTDDNRENVAYNK